METEYEATFTNIEKKDIQKRLKSAGAILLKKEFLQKRTTFSPPQHLDMDKSWLRVRDEGDRITMSYKVMEGTNISDQKEICIQVDDYDKAVKLCEAIAGQKKAYLETRRELWSIDEAEISIDEWPFLEPFVEVEGDSEQEVKRISEKLGFSWSEAKFCAIGTLYKEKYGISLDEINNNTPRIVFDMENPFINRN